MKSVYRTKTVRETLKVGEGIAKFIKRGDVLCFYGELGSGKTTLIQSIIHYYVPEKRVLSPTFIIVRHYEIQKQPHLILYHLDLYRLQENDVKHLGITEQLGSSDTIFAIEWAEKLGDLMPKKRIDIFIQTEESGERFIQIWRRK